MFYIIDTAQEGSNYPHYNLRLTANHECVAAHGEVLNMLTLIEEYIVKYGSEEGIIKRINNMERSAINEITLNQRKEQYKKGPLLFMDDINEVIEKALIRSKGVKKSKLLPSVNKNKPTPLSSAKPSLPLTRTKKEAPERKKPTPRPMKPIVTEPAPTKKLKPSLKPRFKPN